MSRYVAFLRAINVGSHIVKMEQLRGIFASLGLNAVETFIASGNVVFESPAKNSRALETKLEAALQNSLGYAVATFVRSMDELAEVARREPFASKPEGVTLFVAFLHEAVSTERQASVMSLESATDKLHFQGRELYWLCLTRMSDSVLSGARLEKMLGAATTLRNANTVRRLAAKCSVG